MIKQQLGTSWKTKEEKNGLPEKEEGKERETVGVKEQWSRAGEVGLFLIFRDARLLLLEPASKLRDADGTALLEQTHDTEMEPIITWFFFSLPPIRPLLSSSKHQSTPFMSSPYPVSVQPCSPSSNGPSWTRPKGKAQSKDDTQNQPEAQTNSYVVWAQPWDSVLGQSDLNQTSPLLWIPISQEKSWPNRKAEETDSTLTILKYKHQRNWFVMKQHLKERLTILKANFVSLNGHHLI